MMNDERTNPGIVLGTVVPEQDLYRSAVRDVVELSDVEALLEKGKYYFKGYKNRRGLIGATSALAWAPESGGSRRSPDITYELMGYREKGRWGTRRDWDDTSAEELDLKIPSTFDNFDPRNGIARITPHTPCPVLYGIRGTSASELFNATKIVRIKEPLDRYVIFETNHASDDHLRTASVTNFMPYRSVIIRGSVINEPESIKGGHTLVQLIDDDDARFDCAAYEPTKEFRDVVRALVPGDRIVVYGGLRHYDRENKKEQYIPTVNLEKLQIEELAVLSEKTGNPACPDCGRSMKSIGKEQGYRCRKCGTFADYDSLQLANMPRELAPGFYEVPVCARRHLSCPIRLYRL